MHFLGLDAHLLVIKSIVSILISLQIITMQTVKKFSRILFNELKKTLQTKAADHRHTLVA